MGIRGIYVILWAILLVIVTGGLLFFISIPTKMGDIQDCRNSLTANRIIDGDTFELCTGEKIRLLCVDTPEKGKDGYEEAKDFLEYTLSNKELTLKPSNYEGNDTDKYGRYLSWVYIKDESNNLILVNKLILEEGYGDLLIIPPEKCNEVSD